jgi:ligand-binding sensor domain-containing protein
MFCFFTSCNGQNQTQKIISEQKLNTTGQPKLVKTQGSNQADNIHCGLQDKAGNLWFGTTGEGVYRYDGKLFTQYTVKDGLTDNKVWSILEDKIGNIWFGTDNGICRYDGKAITHIPITTTTNISSYPGVSSNNNQSAKNAVWSILQDKSGTIYFGTDEDLYSYNGKSFTLFLDNPGIINKSGLTLKDLQCMFEDKKGNIWFGSGYPAFEGIFRYDGKTVENFKPKNEGWILNITEDKNGNILFATRHSGVLTYDGKNFSSYAKPQQLRNDLLNTIFVDKQKNIWYTSDYMNDSDITTGGVWRDDGKSFVEFTKKDGLTNTSVYFMMQDSVGNIWFGTRNTGLYKYDGKTFTSFAE